MDGWVEGSVDGKMKGGLELEGNGSERCWKGRERQGTG
jgi:hypothetical protein